MSDVALVVEGTYPYVTGGVSEWTQQLISGLPDVSFTVVHLGDGGTPRYERPENLERVIDVPADASSSELPDASVYHALATGSAGAVAGGAAARRGRRFIMSEHGIAWIEARIGIHGCNPHGQGDPRRVLEQARQAYGEAFAVTAVCEWAAERQRSLGARDVHVIQNAASVPAARLSRAADAPLVGFVGRVVAVKDVLTFLEACRLVAVELPSARFVVVGPLDQEPQYAERCRAYARAAGLDVEFTGSADPASWYPRLDALVLTSRSEAQPLVLLEAMAAGVPVVATAVGGCAELLEGRGLLTAPRDPSATAAAVLALLRDPGLRERLTGAARARIEQEHRPEALLQAFASLYEAAA